MAVLNERVLRFIEEYEKDGNGTQAAIRSGYSAVSAHTQGWRLLRRVEVQAALATRQSVRAAHEERRRGEKIDINQERILFGLAGLAFSDIRNAVSWDESGKLKITASDKLDNDTASAIQSVKTRADGTQEIKFYNKQQALVDLGKFIGLTQIDPAEILRRLLGADAPGSAPKMETREAARRIAVMLRRGQGSLPTPR